MQTAKATLVESIPLGMEELRQAGGVEYTETLLQRLVENAHESIELVAMYWNLLPDVATEDEQGFSEAQFEELGARHGRHLYQAIERAARRGVRIRVVQSSGFIEGPQESDILAGKYPDRVEIRELRMTDWYGSGIMHQKMWVIDSRHTYIGSANMDWKSISQVKELGIAVENQRQIANDAIRQFEMLWQWSKIEPSPRQVFDSSVGVVRIVPAWSRLLPVLERQSSPFTGPHLRSDFNLLHPMHVKLNGEAGDLFITSHPDESCVLGREPDLDAILHTIRTASNSVCISVMDYSPISRYRINREAGAEEDAFGARADTMVWWPILNDVLLESVLTRGVRVRLMVSLWAHSSEEMERSLRALRDSAAALATDSEGGGGSLEIKRFVVPGWDETAGPDRPYPGHSRVNHPKYIVTDERLHIGTSNMSWRYFANSVGASLNCTHPSLVKGAQAIFDRDWESRFVTALA